MQELAQEYGFNYETATADIDEQALGDRQQNPADLVALLAQAKADAIIGKLRQSEAKPLHGFLLTCDQVVVHQDVIREKPVSQEQVCFVTADPCLHAMFCKTSANSGQLCPSCNHRTVALQAKEFMASYLASPAGTVGAVQCTDLQSGQAFKAVDSTWVIHTCCVHMALLSSAVLAEVYLLHSAGFACTWSKSHPLPGVRLPVCMQTHFREIPPEVVDQVVAEGTVMKCAGALMIENPALVPYITQIEGTQDAVMGLPKALVLQVISQAVQASKGQQTVHLRR